jgi:alkanesulfonate monooxygenase SsuD/methylene tetrahydromethanopterin reductase-like flavin-dependent oxidoreductase (luciferase family)
VEFDVLSLGDHIPAPGRDTYGDTQSDRHLLWVEMGRMTEELGFRGFVLGEHHDSEYILSTPHMVLAAVAAQTSRIRLGTGISLLANADAVRFAENFAALDLLSRGRAEIGIGSGIEDSVFRVFGQDAEMRYPMMREKLELIRRLWSEEEVDWEGEFRTPLKGFSLQPKTFSRKSLPVLRATGSIDTATEVGVAGDKIMLPTMLGSFDRLKAANMAYKDAYRRAGHDPAQMCTAGVAYVYVAEDSDEAEAYFSPHADNYQAMVGREFTKHIMNPAIANLTLTRQMRVMDLAYCGTPEEVAQGIINASDSVGGMERIMVMFDMGGLPADKVRSSMTLFAEQVVPIVNAASVTSDLVAA